MLMCLPGWDRIFPLSFISLEVLHNITSLPFALIQANQIFCDENFLSQSTHTNNRSEILKSRVYFFLPLYFYIFLSVLFFPPLPFTSISNKKKFVCHACFLLHRNVVVPSEFKLSLTPFPHPSFFPLNFTMMNIL